MAQTFPVALDDFFEGLKVKTQVFSLSEAVEISETQGGEIIQADYGPRLWQGSVTIVPNTHVAARCVAAKIEMLREAGASFFIYDKALPGPASDPDGTTLGASTPKIYALGVNNKELRIDGLPVGYQLGIGDRVAFAYGTGPVRYGLHEFMADVSADSFGRIPLAEVRPFLRPGATVATAVQLLRPYCKAVLVPGSVNPGVKERLHTSGLSFRWRQTLR